MYTPRFDAVDTTDPATCAAFLDLALSVPDVQRWKRFSHELLRVSDGDRVLDIGCGNGDDAISLARYVGARGQVIGVDLSRALLAIAETRAASLRLPIAFQQANINNLPFADSSFDRVRVDRVLHFLADPCHALRQAARVTAPSGRVVVTEPDWSTMTISGGDPGLTAVVIEAGNCDSPAARIGGILPQMFSEAGLLMTDHHKSILELRDYPVAMVLCGLEAIAGRAVASSQVSPREAVIWLRSLRQASVDGSFFCSLGGAIASGTVSIDTSEVTIVPSGLMRLVRGC